MCSTCSGQGSINVTSSPACTICAPAYPPTAPAPTITIFRPTPSPHISLSELPQFLNESAPTYAFSSASNLFISFNETGEIAPGAPTESYEATILGTGVSGLVAASVLLSQPYRRILVADTCSRLGGNHSTGQRKTTPLTSAASFFRTTRLCSGSSPSCRGRQYSHA